MSATLDTSENIDVEQLELPSRGSNASKVHFRLELPDPRYEEILSDDTRMTVRDVMVNHTDAGKVLDTRGGFDDILEPHHRLSVTGTEDDEILVGRRVYDCADLLEEIGREVEYIPDFTWVYGTMSEEAQMKAVDIYSDRLGKLYELIEERGLSHVTVTPLAKGFKRSHFERLEETFKRLGIDRYAMYVVQKNSINRIVEDTRVSITVLDPDEVLVIGRGSPSDVAKLPNRVNAVASLRNWKNACGLDSDGYSDPDLFRWRNRVKEALENGRRGTQARMTEYTNLNEVTA